MADNSKRFPAITAKNWFALRKLFKRKIPVSVTNLLVATELNMSQDSARANVVGPLKLTGLIDKEGKPTPLATRWRDDEQYADVCHEIREAIYPDELTTIAPDGNTPQTKVEAWIANKFGIGQSAASKQAMFYFICFYLALIWLRRLS